MGEILKAEKLFAFLLELASFAPEGLHEQAGKVGDRKEPQKVHDQPGAKAFECRERRGSPRQFSIESQNGHGAEKREADGRVEKSNTPGEDDTPDDDHQQVERNEIAFLRTGQIDQEGNHYHVARHLKAAVPACFRKPPEKNEVQDAQGDPEGNEREEKTVGA